MVLARILIFCALIDALSGVALDLETGVPCYQVEVEEAALCRNRRSEPSG
jgi:hypothetical protein